MERENNRVHELRLIIEMGASDEAWNMKTINFMMCVKGEKH